MNTEHQNLLLEQSVEQGDLATVRQLMSVTPQLHVNGLDRLIVKAAHLPSEEVCRTLVHACDGTWVQGITKGLVKRKDRAALLMMARVMREEECTYLIRVSIEAKDVHGVGQVMDVLRKRNDVPKVLRQAVLMAAQQAQWDIYVNMVENGSLPQAEEQWWAVLQAMAKSPTTPLDRLAQALDWITPGHRQACLDGELVSLAAENGCHEMLPLLVAKSTGHMPANAVPMAIVSAAVANRGAVLAVLAPHAEVQSLRDEFLRRMSLTGGVAGGGEDRRRLRLGMDQVGNHLPNPALETWAGYFSSDYMPMTHARLRSLRTLADGIGVAQREPGRLRPRA